MNPSQGVRRKEKKNNVYVILFIVFAVINVFLYFFEGSILQGTIGILVFAILLYYGLRNNSWAEIIIKWMVWIYIAIAILFLINRVF